MLYKIMYIELKSGYSDDGPAWIGRAAFSKSGKTIYFNNKALKRWQGICGNYFDIQTKEEYWCSGVKKDGSDRHWAGNGKIMIDRKIINEYLKITGEKSINLKRLEIVDIEDSYPVERTYNISNIIQDDTE